jgi:capsular polysaccharide export protein
MAPVEFIVHTKHLVGFRRAAKGRILEVPRKFGRVLRELLKRHGFLHMLSILTSRSDLYGLQGLVERNLQRRKIRLPGLYGNVLVGWIYQRVALLRARLFAALIADYFADHPRAHALVFNGFLMPDALTLAVANHLQRSRLVAELGFFPDTLQYDVRGINFGSSLPRDPDFYRPLANRLPLEKPQDLVRRKPKQKGHSTDTLPSNYIFVPMQVPSDMQILVHSPWIRNMVHLYETLFALAERHPERHFVVKEHPSFPLSIRSHIVPHQRIHFANHNDTRELIEGAEAVITVNSTVGLEAILLGKKVITLGDAPYNVEGLVLHARGLEELSKNLSILPSWEPDDTLRDLFLRYVYNVFLLRGDRHNPTEEMMEAIRLRAEQADLHHRYLSEFATNRAPSENSLEGKLTI